MSDNYAKGGIFKRARRRKHLTLRLTSLIDVFIILLVFLIKNISARPEVTLFSKNLQLPISTAGKTPKITTTISATEHLLLINGKIVESIQDIIEQKELLNENLYDGLLEEKKKTLFLSEQNPDIIFSGEAIIQADKNIPYKVIKKLIYTCGQAEFGEISLQVLRKE